MQLFAMLCITSHKTFSGRKQAHVGMDPHKLTKQDGNDTAILSQYPYVLCHFANYALLLVIHVHRRVVEGSGVGSAAWGCSAC